MSEKLWIGVFISEQTQDYRIERFDSKTQAEEWVLSCANDVEAGHVIACECFIAKIDSVLSFNMECVDQ